MSILDSLNPINLAKNAVESLVDSVLPEPLKAVGRDLADTALDFVGGNYAALGNDVGAFMHDAGTALAPLATAAGNLPAPATEPDAPPASTADSGKSKGPTSTGKAAVPPATAGATSAGDSVATDVPVAAGTAAPSAGATDDAKTTTASSSDSTSTDKSSKTTSKSKSTTTSKSTASSDAKDVTKFFAQSDTDLMAAVRDGKLPDAVKDDPAAMQRLQLRMNEISEMNQLISQMLAAMHDMNKAVIQNIRA